MTVPSEPDTDKDTAVQPTQPTQPPRPRRVWLLATVALLVLAVDLVTKLLAVRDLEGASPYPLLDGLVYLQLVRNPGAAFGMATGMTWLLTLIAVGVVVAIVRVAARLRSRGWAVALGLVLGGALGNLVDRMFRFPGPLHGWVIDFISVFAPDGRVWPVFNAADSSICTGGALLVLLALLGMELDGTRVRGGRRSK
ncbi:signal peptidase II [Pseudonocardia acaciae]|uniref:signal peptidase II n=1 Tax=Pseudonocardia acaciae TaxID=551276 RepID=UPI00048F1ECB|nr:signal peptidase II [Pseudonocardia acaciae]